MSKQTKALERPATFRRQPIRLGMALPLAALAFVTLLSASEPLCAQEDRRVQGQAAFTKGVEALKAGRLKEAIENFEQAEGLAPDGSVLARIALARCHRQRNDFDRQIEAAQSALDIATTPEFRLEAYRLLASGFDSRSYRASLRRPGDIAAAEEAYRRALELAEVPVLRAALLAEHGSTLIRQDRYQEGIAQLLEAFQLQPTEEFARRTRWRIEGAARPGRLPDEEYRALLARVRRFLTSETAPGLRREGRILLCSLRRIRGAASEGEASSDAAASTSQAVPLHVEGDIEAPRRIFGEYPRYTWRRRRAGTRAEVITRLIVDREGCVTGVEILESPASSDYGERLRRAQKKWVFEPATRHGEPVAVYWNKTTQFWVTFPD